MEHHHHHHDLSGKKLLFSVVLNLLITLSQFVGGIVSGSLALLSDALHNFSDVMSLLITYYTHKISHRPHDLRRTFGYKRAEILAAMFNASVLIAVSLYLIVEAIDRLIHPQSVASEWVMILAALGIVVNGLSAWLLHRDSLRSLNIRSAYLHLIGDLMSSVAVLAGGGMMYLYGWVWIDSALSLVIALYLIFTSYSIVRESSGVLMQFVPERISVEAIVNEAKAFESIESIHHIHLWQLDDETVFLEARINFLEDMPLSEVDAQLRELSYALMKIGVTHTMFQPQVGKNGRETVPQRCGITRG